MTDYPCPRCGMTDSFRVKTYSITGKGLEGKHVIDYLECSFCEQRIDHTGSTVFLEPEETPPHD